jgi:glycosyltransferase involved in cell wall biosynthesis
MAPRRIVVIIPCFNEAAAIGGVVAGFRAALPKAAIFVYDNNCRDDTAALARAAGAHVRRETRQGKGNVIRRAFADVEADVYVLVDGDGTYDPGAAPAMVERLIDERLDMVTATRLADAAGVWRPGHRLGNRVLTGLVQACFGHAVGDMLSGYRVFSRRFVKSFPALAAGFETETELTVHALELSLPVAELPTPYHERLAGSSSKLHTVRDGLRILRTIVVLVKDVRPLAFFSLAGAGLLAVGLGLGAGVVVTFLETGLVPRLPTAVLAMGLVLASLLSLACGLILDSVARGRKESKRLAYLRIPAVEAEEAGATQ